MSATVPKLALVRQRYAQDGGAERFVARAMEALRGRQLALTLVTRAWTGGQDFNVLTCNPFYLGRVWRDWSFARCVCRALASGRFDLVQSHERIACCDVYRAGDGVHREWLKQLRRVRGPLGRAGLALNPYHIYIKRAERALFESPRLKAVICNSHMVRDEIVGYFQIAPEKLHVIYSGIDLKVYHPALKRYRAELRARYGVKSETTLYLFVGSGFERKGIPALLTAMKELPSDTTLWVVGRDKKQRHYQAWARRVGLGERVRFLGAQPDVTPFYGAADAVVLPTLYDPFPNVALEAMAAGLPLVTSYKSGAGELVRDGENGLVCDALDSAALASAMRRLTDPDARAAMGGKARLAVEGFGLEEMGSKLAALYAHLLQPN